VNHRVPDAPDDVLQSGDHRKIAVGHCCLSATRLELPPRHPDTVLQVVTLRGFVSKQQSTLFFKLGWIDFAGNEPLFQNINRLTGSSVSQARHSSALEASRHPYKPNKQLHQPYEDSQEAD
jgi:hypothetical protein